MGIELNILKDGEIKMSLTEHSIKKINFKGSKDLTIGAKLDDITRDIEIIGKINIATINECPVKIIETEDEDEEDIVIREIDSVRNLANFAFIPEYEDCYMNIELVIKNAMGQIVKTAEFKNIFVVEYKERFNYDEGDGELYLLLREKEAK